MSRGQYLLIEFNHLNLHKHNIDSWSLNVVYARVDWHRFIQDFSCVCALSSPAPAVLSPTCYQHVDPFGTSRHHSKISGQQEGVSPEPQCGCSLRHTVLFSPNTCWFIYSPFIFYYLYVWLDPDFYF